VSKLPYRAREWARLIPQAALPLACQQLVWTLRFNWARILWAQEHG